MQTFTLMHLWVESHIYIHKIYIQYSVCNIAVHMYTYLYTEILMIAINKYKDPSQNDWMQNAMKVSLFFEFGTCKI